MADKKKPAKTKEIREANAQSLDMSEMSPVTVKLNDFTMSAMPKDFSTGSKGWHCNGKMVVEGHQCQVNVLLTIIGSKPKKDGE